MTRRAAPEPLSRTLLPLVAAALLASCATGGWKPSERVTGEEAVVEVHNDLSPPREITVRVLSSTGQRVLIGTVPAGRTRTLRFQASGFNGQYRLAGESMGGSTVTSSYFTLSAGDRLVWTVGPNLVRFDAGG